MKSTLLAATAALLVITGCATSTPETPQANADQPATYERVYRPGSNIIQKDRVVLTKEEKEKQADEARQMLTVTQRPVTR